jgi:phosphoribosylaminoimidazolecarboxamide formyltransferase/IMP cyclohydrolase
LKAILSVYNKAGVAEFAKSLVDLGFDLVSTGGTHRELAQAGLPVQQIAELTGSPEMLGGRVKTLHPKVHGGILARRHLQEDVEQLAEHGIEPIDLVVGNLYPFRETVSKPDVSLDEALENIDIGGPTLIRAAAKNFPHVLVVVDPEDYEWVISKLRSDSLAMDDRQGLARKAFQHVAVYDTAIAQYLTPGNGQVFPQELTLGMEKLYDLRYGENPHQQAAVYAPSGGAWGLTGAQQLHGRELSFNNLVDASAAWAVASDFDESAVAVIKHTNPCGLASHEDVAEAYRRAYQGDPVSAYGGIVAYNRPVTLEAAEAMSPIFYEVVIAPGYGPEALEALKKKRNLRILVVPLEEERSVTGLEARQIVGGFLMQTPDDARDDPASWKTVTQKQPTPEQLDDLAFAWTAAKHVKSNAIVLAKGKMLLGMGAGQPNRVTSVRLAAQAVGEGAADSVLASDAMFPFADNVEAAAEAGVSAIVQPGGSIRDQEVIEAADRLGLAMVFTGVRHFRH